MVTTIGPHVSGLEGDGGDEPPLDLAAQPLMASSVDSVVCESRDVFYRAGPPHVEKGGIHLSGRRGVAGRGAPLAARAARRSAPSLRGRVRPARLQCLGADRSDLADHFEAATRNGGEPKPVSNWIMTELLRKLKEDCARSRRPPWGRMRAPGS